MALDKRFNVASFIVTPDKAFINANIKELRRISNNIHVIKPEQEFRLDLISFDLFDTVNLKWVLIYVNDIFDVSDVLSGRELKHPSFSEFLSFLLRTLEEQ